MGVVMYLERALHSSIEDLELALHLSVNAASYLCFLIAILNRKMLSTALTAVDNMKASSISKKVYRYPLKCIDICEMCNKFKLVWHYMHIINHLVGSG